MTLAGQIKKSAYVDSVTRMRVGKELTSANCLCLST